MSIDCTPFTDPASLRLTIDQVKTDEDAEAFLNWASEDFHNDPSNPSSCAVYVEHYVKRCPCENEAEKQLKKRGF